MGDEERTLENELRTLRSLLKEACEGMADDDEGVKRVDRLKAGGLVVRLTDAIGRALLRQQKLAMDHNRADWLHAEFDRVVHALEELGRQEMATERLSDEEYGK